MSLFYSALLGILQGLTEFLPVSSSGHLVLVQSIIPNFKQPGVLFDVTLHFGTLFAVLFFFRKKLLRLSLRYILFLIIGTIPAVIIGFFFKDFFVGLFSSFRLVGYALLISGILNFLIDKTLERNEKPDLKKSVFVGIAQAFAIFPGVSRSGSTIFAGVKSGLSCKDAAEFSFLLSAPAIIGANILEIFSSWGEKIDVFCYLTGFLFAFVSGIAAIGLVLKFLEEKKFKIFAIYCFILGLTILLF